jgi:integrase
MRKIHRLTASQITKLGVGMHADGAGLYLQITEGAGATLNRSWLFRFALLGARERQMGLGSVLDVSLAQARQKAADARRLKSDGIDPLEAKIQARATAAALVAKRMSFDECATQFIAAHRDGWQNIKHLKQWQTTLAEYVSPVFGKVSVREVDTGMVMRVIQPMWKDRTETAYRVRGRIERVLDWAKARGYRDGENPARWTGHLINLLPKRQDVRRTEHHEALAFDDLPAFVKELRDYTNVAARTIEFVILTAVRTSEALGATLDEIDRDKRIWTIPAARHKTGKRSGKDLVIPLSDRAMAIIDELAEARTDTPCLFPGRDGALGTRSMLFHLETMGRKGLTVHGFRSTFRDWAAERTNFANEVVEMALGHVIANKVEAAYRRGDLFEKRRRLMDAWAEFCERGKVSAGVTTLRARQ